ncbi:MAG: 3D-(3,5/4)-trihydroxycyclohexane-1,2-dione acylhydrolase (decyclizing) [Deltaproteobacteria bacterium]
MVSVKMTVAEAIVAYLAAQDSEQLDGTVAPAFGGVFAIFGHGNVAGVGQALAAKQDRLPTFRGHNEQSMTHAAVAFAKATFRRRMMATTTSIGPGATNLVTAAATAHANRLPVLLLPGDVFATRAPDPVLQQIEDFGAPGVTANDCLAPVSRYFDRITRPEQILAALPAAMETLMDPVRCGPATLALPQDVQVEAVELPASFLWRRTWRLRRPAPDDWELAEAIAKIGASACPLIVAGGGVLYAGATKRLVEFAERFGVPVAVTQAGKSAIPDDHPLAVGGIGVTGTAVANDLAAKADLVLFVGTRLSDFTSASRTLFTRDDLVRVGLNVAAFDAVKHRTHPLVADADVGLAMLADGLEGWSASSKWQERLAAGSRAWEAAVAGVTAPSEGVPTDGVPTDAQVLGAVNAFATQETTVVCAAGGLPGELHKLWRATEPGSYHVEYGYSCMGYEIAGGLGVKMARPEREVVVMVGDGSYLMLNAEIVTSVALAKKLIIVLLDNRGFGCINRLQQATGGAKFNNLLDEDVPRVDFAAHARAMGAVAEHVPSIDALPAALQRAREADRTAVVVIATDPERGTSAGGAWWDVPVSENQR